MTARPLLLIDVDGVLNPFVKPGPEWASHKCMADGRTWTVLLNQTHGQKLLDLADAAGCELVWATTWEHDANREIGPKIGLPELPVIEVDRNNRWGGPADVLFKTPHVADWVQGRPFVWLDDDLEWQDDLYLTDHPGVGDFLVIHVDPDTGVTDADLERALEWFADLDSSDVEGGAL